MSDPRSSSRAWQELNCHFLPQTAANINLHEYKLSKLRMKPGEDPHTFFSHLEEMLGVLLMLWVGKDDRTVCQRRFIP